MKKKNAEKKQHNKIDNTKINVAISITAAFVKVNHLSEILFLIIICTWGKL